MSSKKVILLLSGGIDSTTLLAKLSSENYQVTAISFYYGQKHEIELKYAMKNAQIYGVQDHRIIELDKTLFDSSALVNRNIDIESFRNTRIREGKVNVYAPFRNLLFISTALSLAESMSINEIHIAINKDDGTNFWDCRRDFIDIMNELARSNSSIQIKSPFLNLQKHEIVKLAQELGVQLKDTITCYQPVEEEECGVCLSCITKQKALRNL